MNVINGLNDLRSTNPDLVDEWHPTKNEIKPEEVTKGSHKKVWWQCKYGHEWEATIEKRAKYGRGCPYCAGKKVLIGFNDLKTTNPDLADEWHPTKNDIKPEEVTKGSHKKVWWQCKYGHEWEATINSRHRGLGCPFCSNKRVLPGYNDLNTTNPVLANEWHPTRNSIKSTEVLAGSGEKVWWQCSVCGFEWKAEVSSRNKGRGCPRCAAAFSSSFPEQAILFYLKKRFEIVESRNTDYGFELDIFIPSERVAIEYDGVYWHKKKIVEDNKKDDLCVQNGIKLIRVREKGLEKTESALNIIRNEKENDEELDSIIEEVFNSIASPAPIINVKQDRHQIISAYIKEIKGRSLASVFPEIAKEWHPRMNGELRPEMVLEGSHIKVWWQCSVCNHEWETTVKNRCNGRGCPKCANRNKGTVIRRVKTHAGDNTLRKFNPSLAEEWHPILNGNLTADDVSPYSKVKVWWIGKCGHEWEATVERRSSGTSCPYCAGKKVLIGFNDLKTTNPDLADEWHPTKNEIKPEEVTKGSNKKVWWQCSVCGFEWQTGVNYRVERGGSCPNCKKKLHSKHVLDYKKNFKTIIKTISPSIEVGDYYNSSTKVLCRCKICNYEWKALPHNLLNGHGCPKCSGNLKITNEEFISRVNALSPNIKILSDYKGRKEKIKCRCLICRKEWETSAGSILNGSGCPFYRAHPNYKGGNKKTTEEFKKELHLKNPNITINGEYKNAITKINCICNICGFEWSSTPNNLLNGYGILCF